MIVAGSEFLGFPFSFVALHVRVGVRLFDFFGDRLVDSGGLRSLVIIFALLLLFLEKTLLCVGWVGSKVLLFCFSSFLTMFTLFSSSSSLALKN
jgi:hypothetical protein